MKKVILLPAFAVAMMVSQAAAAGLCTTSGGEVNAEVDEAKSTDIYYCEYEGKDCRSINNQYSPNTGKSCSDLIAACKTNGGSLFKAKGDNLGGKLTSENDYGTGVRCKGNATWTGEGKDPDAVALGCCKWSPGTKCWTIWSGPDPEDATKTGAEKATECQGGANSFWNGTCPSGGSCPSGNPVYDGSANDCKAWCKWGSGCDAIVPDDCSGVTGDCTPTANCTEAKANCELNSPSKTVYTNSSCTGGQVPILGVQSGTNLTVATHGHALHISSDRNATVTLYTLAGQKVLSGVVQAGSSVFSLKGQNPGVYYAVVQAGFNTQTVNVVLK